MAVSLFAVALLLVTAVPSYAWGGGGQKKKELMPNAWFEKWSAAALATDPVGAKQTPPVVRTPNGVVQDTREYWLAGRALWEPSGIKAPTLIVVGEWDAATPIAGAQAVDGYRMLA